MSSDSDAARCEIFFALKIVLIGPHQPDFQVLIRKVGAEATAASNWSTNRFSDSAKRETLCLQT